MYKIDLSGKRFDRLVVLSYDEEKSKVKGRTYWFCKCDCGKIISVNSTNLISGNSTSCGCKSSEKFTSMNSKSNKIEFDNKLNCYKIYFNNYNGYFLIDQEDLDVIKNHCWYFCNGYAVTTIKDECGIRHTVKSHRIIMSKYFNINGLTIDHINHDTLNNRKYNLRVCTIGENTKNSRPRSTTGEKHIYFNKDRNTYVVHLNDFPGKSFKTFDDAMEFRDILYKSNPDELRYDKNIDIINGQREIIRPFIFVNN